MTLKVRFWHFLSNLHSSIDFKKNPLSMLILGRKSCFLGPTKFEIPQPNWYYSTPTYIACFQPFPVFCRRPRNKSQIRANVRARIWSKLGKECTYLMWNVKWNETWAYFKLTQGALCNQNKKEGNCQHRYLPIYVTKKVLLFFMFSFPSKKVLPFFMFSFAFNLNTGFATQFFALSGFISALI